MPLLDCRCKQCNHEYEYSVFRSDDNPKCPLCASADYEKLISKNTGFELKGGGWHNTDYNKRGPRRKS